MREHTVKHFIFARTKFLECRIQAICKHLTFQIEEVLSFPKLFTESKSVNLERNYITLKLPPYPHKNMKSDELQNQIKSNYIYRAVLITWRFSLMAMFVIGVNELPCACDVSY